MRSKKKSDIRSVVSRKLKRSRKEDSKHTTRIIVFSVLGFSVFSGAVLAGIFFFVLRPAYNALHEFVDALREVEYAEYDVDDDEDEDEDEDED